MDLLYEFNYCLLFVLFYLNFFIIFGRILGLKIKHVKPGFFTAHKPGFTGLKTGGLPGFSGTRIPGLHSLIGIHLLFTNAKMTMALILQAGQQND